MSTTDGSISGGFAPATNVLLLAPTLAGGVVSAYPDPLTDELPAETDVLVVTLVRPVGEHLRNWRANGYTPANLGIVDATPGSPAETDAPLSANVGIERVEGPGNLTALGVAATAFLDEWADDGNQIVVYFDSLTSLLQYVEPERAFRFVHALTRRINEAGAVGYFHLGADAHDEETVRTLQPLFDETIEVTADGECTLVTSE